MIDEILGHLMDAKQTVQAEPAKSRELSLVLTKIEEAILWRDRDLWLKRQLVDEQAQATIKKQEAPNAEA
jgi:hypothetical protein